MAAISLLSMAFGAYLLTTALLNHESKISLSVFHAVQQSIRSQLRNALSAVGLGHLSSRTLLLLPGALAVCGASIGFLLFGSITAALAFAILTTIIPLARERQRHADARVKASESWPRLIEEIRVYTSSLGMSVPQALFAAGKHAPTSMRIIFDEVERDWLLSHDFERTVAALKLRLNDATADATFETLRIAYRIGGSEINDRLDALIQDRIIDIQGRKDARAKQAGAKFARKFVLVVPLGMGLVGLSIGNGRSAYETLTGQLLIVIASATIAVCWLWASYFMRIPTERRVLTQ